MSDPWITHVIGLAKMEENVGKRIAFETCAEKIATLQATITGLREVIDSKIDTITQYHNAHALVRKAVGKAHDELESIDANRIKAALTQEQTS